MSAISTEARPGAKSQVRFLRMSASKARVVLDLIRGKSVAEATDILFHSPRLASEPIAKCMNSAVANADHNEDIPSDELFVSECFADEGATLKRFRPRARGRAGRINKRTCHITIVVSRYSDDELDSQRASAEAKAASSGKKAGAKSGASKSDRSARVAKSKAAADDAVETATDSADDEVTTEATDEAAAAAVVVAAADEVAADEVAADEVAEVAEETSEATSPDVDSDADGESNATDESPYGEGSHALIDGDADNMPKGFEIKGNASSKLYHVPGSAFYARTNPEVWFASEEAAEAAGFQKPASQRDEDTDAAQGEDA